MLKDQNSSFNNQTDPSLQEIGYPVQDDPGLAMIVNGKKFVSTPKRSYIGTPIIPGQSQNFCPTPTNVSGRIEIFNEPDFSPKCLPKASMGVRKTWQELQKLDNANPLQKYLTRQQINEISGRVSKRVSIDDGLGLLHEGPGENSSDCRTNCEIANPRNSIDLLQLGSPFAMKGEKAMMVQKDIGSKAKDGFPKFIEKWKNTGARLGKTSNDATWKMFRKTPFLNKTGTFGKYSAMNPRSARKYDFLSKTLDNRYDKVVQGVRNKNRENKEINIDPKKTLVGSRWMFVDSIPNKMIRKKVGKSGV